MIEVKIDEQDERFLINTVAEKLTRYMLDKQMSQIISAVIKEVSEEIKAELEKSGQVEEKVDKVVKRIEQSLISRTQKQMTETIDKMNNSTENLSPDAKRMRDTLIATMIGYQNELGNDTQSEAYQAYQRVMELIEKNYGPFMR